MDIKILDFDWNDGNIDKCQKHGVALDDIEALFKKEGVYIGPDMKHSQEEQRFLSAGKFKSGKPMFVVFTHCETLKGQ